MSRLFGGSQRSAARNDCVVQPQATYRQCPLLAQSGRHGRADHFRFWGKVDISRTFPNVFFSPKADMKTARIAARGNPFHRAQILAVIAKPKSHGLSLGQRGRWYRKPLKGRTSGVTRSLMPAFGTNQTLRG